MRGMRVLRRAVLGVGGALLLGYGLLCLLNGRDDSPSPAARHYAELRTQREVPPAENNAYLYLLGFEAPPDKSPIEWGLMRQALADPDSPVGSLRPVGEVPLFVAPLIEACKANQGQCQRRLLSQEGRISEWLAAEQRLAQRYQALIQLTSLHDARGYDLQAALPGYSPLLRGQQLGLVWAWQRHRLGETAAARDWLEQDLRFWRMALAQSDILITRMVATAAIRQHFLWAVQLFRGQRSGWRPAEWSRPLSEAERSWGRVQAGELAFVADYLRQLKLRQADWLSEETAKPWLQHLTAWVGAPLLLPQHSLNEYAQLLGEQRALFEAPYPALVFNRTISRAQEREHARLRPSVEWLRNPAGRLLWVRAGDTGLTDYYLRVADLEGLRRAALLIVEMRDLKLTPQQAAGYVRASALRDPYREQPFAWEAATVTLGFQGLADQPAERLQY